MDLTYPTVIRESLDRIGKALADVSLRDEAAASSRTLQLWQPKPSRNGHSAPAASPLAQVLEFRALGAYAMSLPELLARAGRGYLPIPETPGPVALGWPDASAPWQLGQPLTVRLDAGRLQGTAAVAPFCVPADALLLLAQDGEEIVLAECTSSDSLRTETAGDAFMVEFERAPAHVLARGQAAVESWDRAVLWERLALLGITAGVIDRAWRIALESLGEGKRQGHLLADEQVAQFQLADNDIDRLAAERLILDVAVDAERGKPLKDKLAMARYYTSGQAERCAGRALHVAQLFQPRLVPVARWLEQRAHHLATFGLAREHEVRLAAAGLAAGLSLE